jgi:hypothetical protein
MRDGKDLVVAVHSGMAVWWISTLPLGVRSIGNPYRVQAHQDLDVFRKPKYIRGRTLARLAIDFSYPALHAKGAVTTDGWRSQPLA